MKGNLLRCVSSAAKLSTSVCPVPSGTVKDIKSKIIVAGEKFWPCHAKDLAQENALGGPERLFSRRAEPRGCHGSGQRARDDSPFPSGDHPDPVEKCGR